MKTFTLINNICHERKRRNEITFDSYLFLNIDIFIFEYGNIYIYIHFRFVIIILEMCDIYRSLLSISIIMN